MYGFFVFMNFGWLDISNFKLYDFTLISRVKKVFSSWNRFFSQILKSTSKENAPEQKSSYILTLKWLPSECNYMCQVNCINKLWEETNSDTPTQWSKTHPSQRMFLSVFVNLSWTFTGYKKSIHYIILWCIMTLSVVVIM